MAGLRVVPCATLLDALREVLGPAVDQAPAGGRGGVGRGRKGGGSDGSGLEVEEEQQEEGDAREYR
jgi:hypothetical protein